MTGALELGWPVVSSCLTVRVRQSLEFSMCSLYRTEFGYRADDAQKGFDYGGAPFQGLSGQVEECFIRIAR